MYCYNCGVKKAKNLEICTECGASPLKQRPVPKHDNFSMTRSVSPLINDHGLQKRKENLFPYIVVLIVVVIMSSTAIWYMLHRESNIHGIAPIKSSDIDINKNNAITPNLTPEQAPPVMKNAKEKEPPKVISSDNFIYPSDQEYITETFLSKLSKQEVALIRNEIYARHGYIFQEEEYKNYFSAKPWYHANPNFDDSEFNEIEQANKDTLIAYEKKMGWR